MKKLITITLGLFIVFGSFAQETKTQLQTRFDVIRNETVAGANTKTRVANAYQELADGSLGVYPVVTTGTDTYAGTLLGLDAYSGRIVFATFPNNNTGAATVNFNTIGAANIQKYDGGWTALEADDIIAGKLYRLYHDGTRFQIDLGGGGGSSDGLTSVTTSTAGATITLDMDSQVQRMHVGSASFATAKVIALSNTTNSLVFSFSFTVSNVAAVLTMPSDFVMFSIDWDGTDWTPPATGLYEMGGSFDGTNWIVKIAGPFTN